MKQKADGEQAIKDRAAISVDLVEEHKDDIAQAKKVTYGVSSSQDRRQQRLQIKAQPLLTTHTSTRLGGAASKRQRALLLEVCSRRGSVPVGGSAKSPKRLDIVKTKDLRASLGIKTDRRIT